MKLLSLSLNPLYSSPDFRRPNLKMRFRLTFLKITDDLVNLVPDPA